MKRRLLLAASVGILSMGAAVLFHMRGGSSAQPGKKARSVEGVEPPQAPAISRKQVQEDIKLAAIRSASLPLDGSPVDPSAEPVISGHQKRIEHFLGRHETGPEVNEEIEKDMILPLLKDLKQAGLSKNASQAVLTRLGKTYYNQAWIWGEQQVEDRRALKIRLLRLSIAHIEASQRI